MCLHLSILERVWCSLSEFRAYRAYIELRVQSGGFPGLNPVIPRP